MGAGGTGRDESVARQSYFIEAVGAVHYPRFVRTEKSERRCDAIEQGTMPNSQNLKRSACGIR